MTKKYATRLEQIEARLAARADAVNGLNTRLQRRQKAYDAARTEYDNELASIAAAAAKELARRVTAGNRATRVTNYRHPDSCIAAAGKLFNRLVKEELNAD